MSSVSTPVADGEPSIIMVAAVVPLLNWANLISSFNSTSLSRSATRRWTRNKNKALIIQSCDTHSMRVTSFS